METILPLIEYFREGPRTLSRTSLIPAFLKLAVTVAGPEDSRSAGSNTKEYPVWLSTTSSTC
jgi:hypothetical protein